MAADFWLMEIRLEKDGIPSEPLHVYTKEEI